MVDITDKESSEPDSCASIPVSDTEQNQDTHSNKRNIPFSTISDTGVTKNGIANEAFVEDEISTKRKISHQRSASCSIDNDNQV